MINAWESCKLNNCCWRSANKQTESKAEALRTNDRKCYNVRLSFEWWQNMGYIKGSAIGTYFQPWMHRIQFVLKRPLDLYATIQRHDYSRGKLKRGKNDLFVHPFVFFLGLIYILVSYFKKIKLDLYSYIQPIYSSATQARYFVSFKRFLIRFFLIPFLILRWIISIPRVYAFSIFNMFLPNHSMVIFNILFLPNHSMVLFRCTMYMKRKGFFFSRDCSPESRKIIVFMPLCLSGNKTI